MKKILSLILVITILLLSIISCSEKNPDGELIDKTEPPLESAEKIKTAYIDWFGVQIDLASIPRKSLYDYDGESDFEPLIDWLKANNKQFAVLRVECTGNLIQKVYEDESHFRYHFPKYDTDSVIRLYMEIPVKVIDVLEGDENIVNIGDNVSIEFPGLMLTSSNLAKPFGQWKNKQRYDYMFHIYYAKFTPAFVFPRIGYEYVIIVLYNEETGCITSQGRGPLCELSSVDEFLKYNEHIGSGISNDFYEKQYKQVIKRYFIKIE